MQLVSFDEPMNTKPDHEAIATRAYFIWLASGRVEGQDMHNWLIAEMELLHGWHKLPMRKRHPSGWLPPVWP